MAKALSEEERISIMRQHLWQTDLKMRENEKKVGTNGQDALTREECDKKNAELALQSHTWSMKCLVHTDP